VPGEIVHIEVPADDTEASRQFWGSLFGWMGWFSTCKDPHGNEFGLWQTDTSAST
jgi:predicted enzyme related to lactoylglutathione lyase